MAPLQAQPAAQNPQSVQHFTHPSHPLHKTYMPTDYRCNGCNTLGSGTRYRCPYPTCDFDLHEQCAISPPSLSAPHLHPQHALTLVYHGNNLRSCDLCGQVASGLCYTCPACGFDVHPLCTQLPPQVQHPMHPQHHLTLQSVKGLSSCDICRSFFTGWRYRCNACDVDVHMECLAGQPSPTLVRPPPASYGGNSSGFGMNQHQQYFNNYNYQPVQGNGVATGNSKKNSAYKTLAKLAGRAVLFSMTGTTF